MKLVYNKTGVEIKKDETVTLLGGDQVVITDWDIPHKPGSSGYVYVQREQCAIDDRYYPLVIKAQFVEDEILTKEEFIATKVCSLCLHEDLDITATGPGLIYNGEYHIELLKNGEFMCTIGNMSDKSYYLNEFEGFLWDLYLDNSRG